MNIHEETLKIARNLIKKDPSLTDWVINKFPELKENKENEDEKIRKAIKSAVLQLTDIYLQEKYGLKQSDCIAWLEKQCNLMKALQISNAKIGELIEKNYYLKEQLEKQGENNMGISEATKQKLEDNLNKALEKETPESWNKFLDEKGEQKPVFEMKTPEESLGIDSNTYNKIVDECIYGEQKTADKVESRQEELTEFEKAVKQVMEEAIECGDTHNLKADADMLLRLAQNHSWSEEDKEMYGCALAMVEWYEGEYKKKVRLVSNWLKSLKERYTWKPSDEQMDALHYVTNFDYGGHKATLVSLYEQLKKLKE